MPDFLSNLALGFGVAFSPVNLGVAFVGCVLGTLIGVLPGIGPLATVAMLLPITFYLPPESALIMLAAIYYGAQYGGSTTSILLNMPGEASSVVTCLDGHQMARKGRAGAALAIAGLASFFAGTVSTLLIAAVAVPLSRIGAAFSSADYFSLMVLGLVGAVALARGSVVKAMAMVVLGLLIGLVGTDLHTASPRFTFGLYELSDGIDFVPVAMGLFGLGEIIANLAGKPEAGRSILTAKIANLWPSRSEFRAAWPAALRGTFIGSALGLLPGGGAFLGSFVSYISEKKLAKDPSRFGQGAIEGVAGPEAANNAGAQTSFIPMLSLGIPTTPLMAVIIGAMVVQGITPGPQVMTSNPELFWGFIASIWIGNAMLLVINLPLVGVWVSLLRVPYRLLFPAILLFCCIGVYSVNTSAVEVLLAALFGVLGFTFKRLGFEAAPMMLGMVLGLKIEDSFRRALLLSDGDPTVFLTRPISLGFLLATCVLLVILVAPSIRNRREAVFAD